MTTASPFASARPSSLPEPTTIGRRVGAYAIDAALIGVIVGVAAGIAVSLSLGALSSGDATEALAALAGAYGVATLVALLVVVGYTLMQGDRGSVGQRLLGLRLADAATGEPIGFWRALVRNIIWGLAGSIVVGYFSPLFDQSPRRQGWHDRVARAYVASAAAVTPAPTPVRAEPAPAAPAAPIAAAVVGPPPRFAPGGSPAATAAPAFPGRAAEAGLISFVPGVQHSEAPPAAPAPPAAVPQRPARDPAVFDALAFTGPKFDDPAYDELAAGVGFLPGRDGHRAAGVDPEFDPDFDPVALEETELVRGPVVPPASAPPEPVAPASSVADDATVLTPPRRQVVAALTWDTGERVAVYGVTLFGRDPAAEDGAAVVAVRDETLSLSKTHFEIGSDDDGPWITDRYSTNGTVLVRRGDRRPLPAGVRTSLIAGDRLEFGDRSLLVGDDS